jgi:hypothetical protein
VPTRYVPSSGFGDPLDGLLPSVPCRSCFIPTALLGFTLRSVLLARGHRSFPSRLSPPAVSPVLLPEIMAYETRSSDRPHGPRLLGFYPRPSPWCSIGRLIRRTLEAPLGFALLGFARKDLGQDFARPPLARFHAAAVCYAMWWPTSHSNSRQRRRLRVSIGLCLALLRTRRRNGRE